MALPNAPQVPVALPQNNNPFPAFAAPPVPAATINARDFLRLPIPQIATNDGAASQSSANNLFFHPVDFIHHDQYTLLFGPQLAGYPNAMQVPQNFHPINPPSNMNQITVEAQAVNLGRNYVLQPASFVLERRVPEISYDVEVSIETERIRTSTRKQKTFKGFVDAVYFYNDRPLVLCEFKRPGCFNLTKWRMTLPRRAAPGTMPSLGNEAKRISKQLMKYAHATDRPYFILSDWKNFLFVHLDNLLDNQIPKGAYIEYHRGTQAPAATVPGRFQAGASITRALGFARGNAGWPYLTARAVHCNDTAQFKVMVWAFVMEAHRREAARNNLDYPGPPGQPVVAMAVPPAVVVAPAAVNDDDDEGMESEEDSDADAMDQD
jgi:hypothetical protein